MHTLHALWCFVVCCGQVMVNFTHILQGYFNGTGVIIHMITSVLTKQQRSVWVKRSFESTANFPDSKVHGANMGPIWGRQDPNGPHVGPMNLAIWVLTTTKQSTTKMRTHFLGFTIRPHNTRNPHFCHPCGR